MRKVHALQLNMPMDHAIKVPCGSPTAEAALPSRRQPGFPAFVAVMSGPSGRAWPVLTRHQCLPSPALQLDLHGLHVEEALERLEHHLVTLGGLGSPGGILLQVTPARITCCACQRP